MAFNSKPDAVPEFARNDVIHSTLGTSNVIEPPEDKKDSGWDAYEKPSRNWLNWLFRKIYQWINYFNQFFSETHQLRINEIVEEETDGGVTVEGVHCQDGVVTGDVIGDVTGNLTGSTVTTTGLIQTNSNVQSGAGSGGVALTVNDGYGNANVTWNHIAGTPEQDGNAARITVNTDSTTDSTMSFEVGSNVTEDTAVGLTTVLSLSESSGAFSVPIIGDLTGDVTGGLTATSAAIILPQATTPAQTAEGSVVWDTDNDLLTVGTGSGRRTMVDTSQNQTIGGTKTFSSSIAGNLTGNVTGNLTGDVTGNISGNAATVTNGVYTTGNQTIGGTKTFSSSIVGNLTGNVTGDVTGNLTGYAYASHRIRDVNGTNLRYKIISIGAWNMRYGSSVTVAHGLSSISSVRDINVTIQSDSGFIYSFFSAYEGSNSHGAHVSIQNATYIYLYCSGNTLFAQTIDFSSTTTNRGWVTIWYVG